MYVEVDQINSKWKCFRIYHDVETTLPPHRETRLTKVKERFARRGKFRTSFSLYLREGGGGGGIYCYGKEAHVTIHTVAMVENRILASQ